ncbi:unnamed protein product [Amoebophrya sp. A120]|nr:unnamed protein product [Amoebophrya sp. A120]|eukprot:GSA120T00007857001.1
MPGYLPPDRRRTKTTVVSKKPTLAMKMMAPAPVHLRSRRSWWTRRITKLCCLCEELNTFTPQGVVAPCGVDFHVLLGRSRAFVQNSFYEPSRPRARPELFIVLKADLSLSKKMPAHY